MAENVTTSHLKNICPSPAPDATFPRRILAPLVPDAFVMLARIDINTTILASGPSPAPDATFPRCSWGNYAVPQAYHLGIAVESNGDLIPNGGYEYGESIKIYEATNATESNVLMVRISVFCFVCVRVCVCCTSSCSRT